MKSKSKMNTKVEWPFNYSQSRVFIAIILITIIQFIIYVDIAYLYAKAAKEIKIQLHTQLFKLYHSTTIIEHIQKNQSINMQIQAY